GSVADREVPSYIDEDGVEAGRGTETFAQVEFSIDTPRWEGVPFVLRTGKALGRDRREIVVHFRAPTGAAFDQSEPPANVLRLRLVPPTVELEMNMSEADHRANLDGAELAYDLGESSLSPHAHVLLDLLRGGSGLSVRDDAAEECWRIVEPILDAWAAGASALREYVAGSEGPPED